MNPEAFLYCWTDLKYNKLYVGTHKGSTEDGYVCSGKLMLEQYQSRPENFSRKIIAKGSYNDMISLECAILRSVNAAKDMDYYNQHNGDGKFYNKGHTLETKEKLKKAWEKRDKTPFWHGKSYTSEIRKKQIEAAKKRSLTIEGKNHYKKIGTISAKKRKDNEEIRNFLSNSTKLIWEKRRLGLLPMPNYKKKKL